jgi:hypothetical protein
MENSKAALMDVMWAAMMVALLELMMAALLDPKLVVLKVALKVQMMAE